MKQWCIYSQYRTGRLAVRALFLYFMLFSASVDATNFDVPIRFDTASLTHLLEETLFASPEGISVWGDSSGCNDLTLSAPSTSIEQGEVFIITRAVAKSGVSLGKRCFGLLRWQGKIKAKQRIDVIDPSGKIAFSTVDTLLLDNTGKVAPVSNVFWKIAKQFVHPLLDKFRIDLIDAIAEIKALLPLFLDSSDPDSVQNLTNSIHLEDILILPDAVSASVKFTLDITPAEVEPVVESELSETELRKFIDSWSRWDAFVVVVLKSVARNPITDDQRDLLLDALLEIRYDIVEILGNPQVLSTTDLQQSFTNGWRLLAPVLREVSSEMTGSKSLQMLGFIAATDVLDAIARLGPVTGWTLSVDGLRRLARLLIDEQSEDQVESNESVDPNLRELFNFDPHLQLPAAPSSSERELLLEPSSSSWIELLIPQATANIKNDAAPLDINRATPASDNIDSYLLLVQKLLDGVTFGTLMTHPLDVEYRKLFHNLVLTTAWQETCWKQYQRKKNALIPVTSSAGALGMMQIMPRVWRGFYDSKSLANDIEYNAAAGTEILHRYLVRYAIRKGEDKHQGGIENLARASYAAYNGGPRHLNRYRQTDTKDSLKKIDNSFWDKYREIRDGNPLAVRQCYPDLWTN